MLDSELAIMSNVSAANDSYYDSDNRNQTFDFDYDYDSYWFLFTYFWNNVIWFRVYMIALSIIIVSGIVGNSLVMYVIVAHRRMRTVINMLLFSVAVADWLFMFYIFVVRILFLSNLGLLFFFVSILL